MTDDCACPTRQVEDQMPVVARPWILLAAFARRMAARLNIEWPEAFEGANLALSRTRARRGEAGVTRELAKGARRVTFDLRGRALAVVAVFASGCMALSAHADTPMPLQPACGEAERAFVTPMGMAATAGGELI